MFTRRKKSVSVLRYFCATSTDLEFKTTNLKELRFLALLSIGDRISPLDFSPQTLTPWKLPPGLSLLGLYPPPPQIIF